MDMQREYWNDVAGPKWAAAQRQMDELLQPYAEALRDAASVPEGATLVDVGCGCGATTLMARQCSPQAEIVGLDVSEPMLQVARKRAEEQALKPIRFIAGDATTQAFAPGSVERVISRFGVMFFADPVAAFANMRSWLTPKGQLVVAVWAAREENPWLTDPLQVFKRHFELPTPDPEAPGPFSLGETTRRKRIFAQAGLRLVEEHVLDQPLTVRGDVPELVRFFSERGPAFAALQEASDTQRAAAMADLEEYVAARHDGEGVTHAAKALRLTLART